jgi:hypothetical protein
MVSRTNLEQLKIASPCPANWNEMKGDRQVRHCQLCRLNVYNFSEMTRSEIERAIGKSEGKMCVRLYRRQDGTVITRDCPKGIRVLRQRVVKRLALAASLVLTTLGCGPQAEGIRKATGLSIFGGGTTVTMGEAPVRTMGAVAPPMTGKIKVSSPSKVKTNR